MPDHYRVENLRVYQLLCDLHIEICDMSYKWPSHERFELGSQIRRSSNSAPANLAEKHHDRHVRNRIEGVNRSRGEAQETVHHLYIALRKQYVSNDVYEAYRSRYNECVSMLNGLERKYEKQLDPSQRTWPADKT